MAEIARGPPTALQVEVKRARDLHDTSLLGKMDPFVEVTLGTKKQKSQTHSKGSRFPTWNQTLSFTYNNERSIHFRVIDKDMISNDYIGCHDFHLGPIVDGSRNFDGELPLSRKKGKPAGYLDVSLKFYGEIGAATTKPAPKPAPVPTPTTEPPITPYQAPPPAPTPQAAPAPPPAPPQYAPYPAYQPPPQPYPYPTPHAGGGSVHVVVGGAPPVHSPYVPPPAPPAYNPYPPAAYPAGYPAAHPPRGYPLTAPPQYAAVPPAYYAPAQKKSKKKKHKKRSISSSSSDSSSD